MNRFASAFPTPPAARSLDFIEGAAARMHTLIDALLALARLGRAELTRQDVDLNELVADVKAEMSAVLEDRPVEWRVAHLPVVRGDQALLRQVLENLLGNAVKYSRNRELAIIEVFAEARSGEHVIHMRDNGAGFDPRFAEKLFGVFQRLHRPEEFEGTGVGLVNVKRIVERHDGRVWATSQPGEGATFSFTLPAVTTGAGAGRELDLSARGSTTPTRAAEEAEQVLRQQG